MKETRVIELQDLKLVLNLMKKLMDMKPEWNEGLMNLYARLYENYYLNNHDDEYDFPFGINDDFVNQDGSIEHDGLDDLIWKLGMNLPSWDDDDNLFNKENGHEE